MLRTVDASGSEMFQLSTEVWAETSDIIQVKFLQDVSILYHSSHR